MYRGFPRSKNFWAGIAFMVISAFAIYFGAGLTVGAPRRMGPGFFPMMLSGCLLVIGAVVAVMGLLKDQEEVAFGSAKPLLIIIAVLLFGLLLQPFGYFVAVAAMILVASMAMGRLRVLETAILILVVTVSTWFVFVQALGLQLPMGWAR